LKLFSANSPYYPGYEQRARKKNYIGWAGKNFLNNITNILPDFLSSVKRRRKGGKKVNG
jgi:hypothetical protein